MSASESDRAPSIEVRTESAPCPLCRRNEPRPYRANMYALGSTCFHLVRCPCGLVYVEPRPDAATIARIYDDPSYYTEGYNLGVESENYFSRRDELLALYDRTMHDLERIVGRPGDMLELGSAGGFLLEAARRRGWRVKGIEISPPAIEYSRRELALEVFAGDLFDAPFAPKSFDLIVADNVLEHVIEPERALRKLRELLRPGGHLVVVVPAYVNSIYFRMTLAAPHFVPRGWFGPGLSRILKLEPGREPPYHIIEFDRRTVTDVIRRAGFELARIENSVPLPAELFKAKNPTLRVRVLRSAFRSLDFLMRKGLAPGARVSVIARAP